MCVVLAIEICLNNGGYFTVWEEQETCMGAVQEEKEREKEQRQVDERNKSMSYSY